MIKSNMLMINDKRKKGEPCKILYLNHAAYIGGAEVALLNLLAYLNQSRFQPVVLAPEGQLAEKLKEIEVRWIPIPRLAGLNRYTLPGFLRVLPSLRSVLFEEKPDLVHANTNFSSEYAGVLSRLLSVPTIGHIRDIEPLGRMGRWTIRQNTRLIVISEAVKQYLIREHVPEHQIVRVYDGVDLHQYQPRQSPFNEKSEVIIGIVGQIGERKGHKYLLEALSALVPSYPQIQLWIVGKEPEQNQEHYTEQLERYIKEAHLEPYVTWWGFRTDIPDILSQLDILALPSLQEPFGKIVIEAMAMEKPVVATTVGGVPEIVVDGKTGLLVPPQDARALRQALERLLLNRETRIAMGIAGRKRVEHLFSLDQNMQHTQQIYAEILRDIK
ncbi:glycosyl transferase group 1 [Candidatus Vecturithrix granuli]|uniref:Glycosyl transferase group 1 n=1 Tax=Vecturithrix granuli TaxID=1499967 RepID=A0A0S6WAH8_VECG1|nr:glycosyl transferase group 1 [Candidatus Vecturithrix granuli]